MKKIALVAGLLAGLLFGVATPLSKLLLGSLNSFQLAGLLYLGAGIAMLPSVLHKRDMVRMLFNRKNVLRTSGIILFGGILGPILLLWGLKTANAASVSIWLNMEVVATAILGVLLFKDYLDRITWLGVALTFAAGVVTSIGEGASGLLSGALITLACVCWGLDNHLTAITDGAFPQAVTFVKGVAAGAVNLCIGMVTGAGGSVSLPAVGGAVLVGCFSYGVSTVLYVTSAQNIGATRSQVLFSTAPLWGVVLSYMFFQAAFQWTHIVSIILLAAAVVLVNIITHTHTHTHTGMEHVHYHVHNDGHHNHTHEDGAPGTGTGHVHMHTHDNITHEHAHYPDLHHRHSHHKRG